MQQRVNLSHCVWSLDPVWVTEVRRTYLYPVVRWTFAACSRDTDRMADQTAPHWPLGPVLESARKALGLHKREAARRAGMSDQLWRRLETGYYTVQGERIPLVRPGSGNMGATAETVIAAARAVQLDPRAALELVGYPASALEGKDDPTAAAERAFEEAYLTFVKAWGPDRAEEAMRRVWRKRHAASNQSPDQPSGRAERDAR